MPMDLDKLSNELEDALERARLLAEQRRHSQITPVHMLYVLLEDNSALAALIEKAGVSCGLLLGALATTLNKENVGKLDPGKRPAASRSLRDLIEKSFEKMIQRGSGRAEGIDFVMAAVEFGEEQLKNQLRDAGVTKQAVEKSA